MAGDPIDDDEGPLDPALALALFASQAAAGALAALRRMEFFPEEGIEATLSSLARCQQAASPMPPSIENHFEGLRDLLTLHHRRNEKPAR